MGSLFGRRKTELGLLRGHRIIEPPFTDLKSLSKMSNTGGVGGDKCGRLSLQTLVSGSKVT
jgi:hypothetical protein